MKIIALFGQGEPEYTSARGLVYGLRKLGHEVVTAGPSYFGKPNTADIPLEDRPHPELYSYEEVLSRSPWKPDLCLCIEPHGYFCQKKPKDIVSAFYITDPHRGGLTYKQIAEVGNYDLFLIGQPRFIPLFKDLRMRVEPLPVGFDERRFSKDIRDDPVCDIVFVGQTGIANMEYPHEDDLGRYATKAPDNLPLDHRRYAFSMHPGFDYAERAEMLIRLCKDFSVRIYENVWQTPLYQKALQRGKVGFNRSLLGDTSIRCLEIMAAGTALVTDAIPGQEDVFFKSNFHCLTYETYFKPFFPNFELEYEQVKKIIKYLLDNEPIRKVMATNGYWHVWQHCTWTQRAKELISRL